MSMYDVENILDRLISATAIVKSCRSELLNMGFNAKEAEELITTYVYKPLNKEE